MLKQALSVFDFLKIKYPDKAQVKVLYTIPLLISLLICGILVYLTSQSMDKSYNFLLSDRFSDTFTFLVILPGFYIASLSAIAAISRKAIDETINENNPPYLVKLERDRPEDYKQILTRRIFLTMLFSYLSAISLILALFLITVRFSFSIYSPNLLVYGIVIFIVFFIIAQIFLLTLVGISYLGYKALAKN